MALHLFLRILNRFMLSKKARDMQTELAAVFRILPADLIAMSLVHLDVILQEKGFSPMAVCEWNSFNGDDGEEARPL